MWGFALFAVLFTGSRKSLIMLAAAIMLAALRYIPQLRRIQGWLLAAAAVAVLGVGYLVVSQRGVSIVEKAEEASSISRISELFSGQRQTRREMIEDAVDLWKRSPWIGWGAGQFAVISGQGVFSHNNYTELLANYGIVGFALFYVLFVVLLVRVVPGAIRWRPECQTPLLLLLLVLVLDGATISSISKPAWLFLIVIARLVTLSDPRRAAGAATTTPLVYSP